MTWTSDTTPKWSASWLSWSEPRPLLVAGRPLEPAEPGEPQPRASRAASAGRAVTVRVDVTDDSGAFLDLLDVRARVLTADGQSDELRLAQTRPGRYETTFTVAADGAYQLDVAQYQEARSSREETGGFVVPYPQEYRAFGLNGDVLAKIAAIGGGRVLRDPRDAFARDILFEGQTRLPLWPYLLGIALVLFPFDVGIRRLKISPAYLRNRFWIPFVRSISGLARLPTALVDFVRRRRPL